MIGKNERSRWIGKRLSQPWQSRHRGTINPTLPINLPTKAERSDEGYAAPEWLRLVKEERHDETGTGSQTCMTDWRVEKYLHYLDILE